MKRKPITPYERLKQDFTDFVGKVLYPTRRLMWTYPKARLEEGWSLAGLAERVAAADQLGYDVVIERHAESGDLRVFYRQKPPARPWNI